MQIVIDISEKMYDYAKKNKFLYINENELGEMIANGIPLDKIRTDIKNHIDKEKLRFGGQFDSGLNLALKIIDEYIKGEDKK